jgi:hypothetical protein
VQDASSALVWLSQNPEVRVLRWRPDADAPRNGDAGPCLWLVESDATPPDLCSCLEDWVWAGASELETQTRLHALAVRAAQHPRHPTIDGYGQLRYRGHSLFLSPTDQRIAEVLIEHFGDVVEDGELLRAVWPRGCGSQVLRVHISRLRRRAAPLGLTITCVRGTGYQLADLPTA